MSPERSRRRYSRTLRVNEVVREVIADELERCSDPRLTMVTVTGVNVSADLRHATVFYAALGRHDDDIPTALRAAAPHLRGVLGNQVRLKYLPRLQFREDPAIEHGQRVEEILRGLHRDTGVSAGDGGGDEPS
ncbi:MAG TPA: 30S ribosome-binding factor RbfA [Acidimicrobiia bacterium]|nr:30S ribosome-binding factor RbfA [Acidimicrobiia bacterium]